MANPTARRRRVGAELRRHRTEAGLTQEQAAERADMTADQLVRIETSRMVRLSVHHVRALLDAYGVDDPDVRAELEQWTRESRSKGWWASYRGVIAERFAGLEDAASVIREYNARVVPGLLQTEEYARAVFHGGQPKATDADIEQRVTARMRRRTELFDNRGDPPDLWMVISEAVLRQMIGGREVMAAQLAFLEEAAKRPGTTIQVLPFVVGAHAAIDGDMIVLEFPDDGDRPVAVIEDLAGTVYVEDDEDVARLLYAHAQVSAAAASPSESLRMIRAAREGLTS